MLSSGETRETGSLLRPTPNFNSEIPTTIMPPCLIALGSNLGDRRAMLDEAVRRMREHPQIDVSRQSQWLLTQPVGGPTGQGQFLNGAVSLETSLGPQELLGVLLDIETSLGRRRVERWGPRTIDLDLLLYGEAVQESSELVIPHARMVWRRFVLEPAAEVAGAMVHPTTGWTVARLLEHLKTARPYLALAGAPGAGKSWLSERLVEKLSVQVIRLADGRPPRQDWSGSPWKREIEFLNAKARLLAPDGPRWSRAEPLWVSDFWLDESLAYAELTLSGTERETLRQRLEEVRGQVVEPKLTVLLDVPGGSREGQAGLRSALGRLAREPGHGPVFRLDASEPEQTLREVLAAVEAMSDKVRG